MCFVLERQSFGSPDSYHLPGRLAEFGSVSYLLEAQVRH